ncbi:MAG TPA: NADH-quinone oxidoreductase subunit F, partial [Agriterribacter sp.]|nr:NADH-quinone oxidoreductase subunit F [Agriterribacter sp.]
MERPLTKNIHAGRQALNLKEYSMTGGYTALQQVLKNMTPQEVQQLVQKSNLKGRGGAGFNTGMKWSFVPMGEDAPKTKYLVANADEMEPGTFKDRLLLEGNPHQLLEGMIIAAFAIQANISYVFLRWAYKKAAEVLEKS